MPNEMHHNNTGAVMDYKRAAKVGDLVVPRELVEHVSPTNIIYTTQLPEMAIKSLCEIMAMSNDHKTFSLKMLDGSDRILDSADYPLENLVIVKPHPLEQMQVASAG